MYNGGNDLTEGTKTVWNVIEEKFRTEEVRMSQMRKNLRKKFRTKRKNLVGLLVPVGMLS